jgi:5-formyltetrahydrofolate cyclo-ligase
MENKQKLRRQMRDRRDQLTEAFRTHASTQACRRLLPFIGENAMRCVAGYAAMRSELDPSLVGEYCAEHRIRWLLPRITDDHGVMNFHDVSTATAIMQKNQLGMLEPAASLPVIALEQIDLIILPLLAFDRHGGRLGYGGGYYDRYLAPLKRATRTKKPWLVGLAFAAQELPLIEPLPHDVGVDFICTEKETIHAQR